MTDTAIVGKKGTGKSLTAVSIAQQYLKEGRKVATNLDIYMDKLMYHTSKKTIIRIPDHPTVDDLNAIGRGHDLDHYEEEMNGALILDECSHFFNARTYQDSGRQATLKWITEARKSRWDIYYLMQGVQQIDKQVRETQIEYVKTMKRTDKWPIPLVTWLTRHLFGEKYAIRFPKGHLVITKQGVERDGMVVARDFHRSVDFYKAYDTEQKFQGLAGPNDWDFVGLHTRLSAWHLKGRYMNYKPSITIYFKALFYYACMFAARITYTRSSHVHKVLMG